MTREWATPAAYTAPSEASAVDDVYEHAARHPDGAAVSVKTPAGRVEVTWRELADRVTALAGGLIESGIAPGDRVALMSPTRYEWMLCDFAIWAAGAVTVPIYETSSAEQVEWILSDSGAVAAFAGDDRCLRTVEEVAVPAVRHVWRMERPDLDRLASLGAGVPRGDIERRRATPSGSVATIVYTSGTTGRPKGCVLTHANLLAEVGNVVSAPGIGDEVLTPESSLLLFLPLAHIFARVVQLAVIRQRVPHAHTGDLKNVAAELREFRPTVVLAVPRVFERVYNSALMKASDEGHQRLFELAAETAVDYSRAVRPGPRLRLRHLIFDRLVYRKLRAAMGGRVRYAVSGAAPLGARLGHFLHGAGITVLEGWGLTETSAGHTLNLPPALRIGTVGRPLPGCAVRIASDGEILAKGPNVFRGYWNNERATAEVFDEDGWFRTGDLGELDDDGFLAVTGRKKEIIVTASGKNVAPAVLEDRMRAHWLIDQCLVVGDARPYIAALVTLDVEFFARWKRETGKPADAGVAALREDPGLLAAVQEAVDDANRAVSRAEAVKRVRVLTGEFTVSDELTPTQKIRRDHVLRKFAAEVDLLYAEPRTRPADQVVR